MTKREVKRIVRLARLMIKEQWHTSWLSSKALPEFLRLSSVQFQAEDKEVRFMLETKERKDYFDSYIKLIQ
jgi:hypothetical protein